MHPLTLGDEHADDAARWHPALAVLGVLAAALAAVLLPTALASAATPTDITVTPTVTTAVIDGRSASSVGVAATVRNASTTSTVRTRFNPAACTPTVELATSTTSTANQLVCAAYPVSDADRTRFGNRDFTLPLVVEVAAVSPTTFTTFTVTSSADVNVFNGTLVAPLPPPAIREGEDDLTLQLTVNNTGNVTHGAPAAASVLLGTGAGATAATSCTAVPAAQLAQNSTYSFSCTWANPAASLFAATQTAVPLSVQVRPTGNTTITPLTTTVNLSTVEFIPESDDTTTTPTTPTTPTEPPVVPDPDPEIDDPNADLELPGLPETDTTPESGVADAGAEAGATVLESTGARLTLLLLTVGLIALAIGWRMTVYTDERDGFIRVQ